MQRQSDVIETRVRLRFDVVASPHLHELFGSVDATRHATLVALMLERCVAYDRAFAGQAQGLIDPRQLQSRETLANSEGTRNRDRISNENGASKRPAPNHLNDENTKGKPAPAPVASTGSLNSCRIPDDCIDKKRYPLFMARDVLRELVQSLQSTGSL